MPYSIFDWVLLTRCTGKLGHNWFGATQFPEHKLSIRDTLNIILIMILIFMKRKSPLKILMIDHEFFDSHLSILTIFRIWFEFTFFGNHVLLDSLIYYNFLYYISRDVIHLSVISYENYPKWCTDNETGRSSRQLPYHHLHTDSLHAQSVDN